MNSFRWLMILAMGLGLVGSAILPVGAQPKAPQKDNKETVIDFDGLKSAVPKEWVPVKPANLLRSHQFRLPGKTPALDAEVAILPDVRGTIEQNINRWKNLFIPQGDKTINEVFHVKKMKVGKADVVFMDVTGTYMHKDRPLADDSTAVLLPNFRMVAVIMETKFESCFVRMIGPVATVEQYQKGFEDWVRNFK
ncbi:MAG: hypothetical protein ACK4RK_20090 [Gemmataceae bacterium]